LLRQAAMRHTVGGQSPVNGQTGAAEYNYLSQTTMPTFTLTDVHHPTCRDNEHRTHRRTGGTGHVTLDVNWMSI